MANRTIAGFNKPSIVLLHLLLILCHQLHTTHNTHPSLALIDHRLVVSQSTMAAAKPAELKDTLEALEEDDEFEEFEDGRLSCGKGEATYRLGVLTPDDVMGWVGLRCVVVVGCADWNEAEVDEEDKLQWEDDWDEADVDDDFSTALRYIPLTRSNIIVDNGCIVDSEY
jgi:hypothetical protein